MSSTLAYRPELDGLRSVAVYLVVAFHAHMVLLEGGFVGVDLFFVLSGFLVTGVLLRDLDTEGRIRLGNFYARRVRRLLPAAVVLIVVTRLVQLLWPRCPTGSTWSTTPAPRSSTSPTGTSSSSRRDYFAQDGDRSPFLHFWSLSIEEQFYIVFPLILVLLRAVRRAGRCGCCGRCSAWSPRSRSACSCGRRATTPTTPTTRTHTRVYQLAAGGAAAPGRLRRSAGTRGAASAPLARPGPRRGAPG